MHYKKNAVTDLRDGLIGIVFLTSFWGAALIDGTAVAQSALDDGIVCSENSECASSQCSEGPKNQSYCTDSQNLCPQPGAEGIGAGETYVFDQRTYYCVDGTGLVSDGALEEMLSAEDSSIHELNSNKSALLSLAVKMACPSQWEDLGKSIDLKKQTEDLWEQDPVGRDSFMRYLSLAMGAAVPDDAALSLMASDSLTVATECATQRASLMQFMIEKMPNDILIAMESVGAGLGEAIGDAVGFTANNPSTSCRAIKESYPDSVDGAYWIKVTDDDTPPLEVFCDMSSDGGGWTFVAYVHRGSLANLFTKQSGKYQLSRARVSDSFSLGIMDKIGDTEMMITL